MICKFDVLNGICAYYTMYPLNFPLHILQKYGKPGEWVLDPFCGRGTTNFAARLLDMPSIGVDSSPVAVALTSAKLARADAEQIVMEAQKILDANVYPKSIPDNDFWHLAYSKQTLKQLCQLREALLEECSSDTRILLRAIILGALHGPRPKGLPSYFSNQSPRTFAPKPKYAIKFWKEHKMYPENIDVISVISMRAQRYLAVSLKKTEGIALLGDSRNSSEFSSLPKIKFIITSPPYYGMRTYLPDQWIRFWFLGGPDDVCYRHNVGQLEHSSATHFASEMRRIWKNIVKCSANDARLVIRFGGIHDRNVEPIDLLKQSLSNSGWRISTIKIVPECKDCRRQVTQFQSIPKKQKTEYDVYCRLN